MLYAIIEANTADANDTATQIKNAATNLANDPRAAEKYRNDLSWLYDGD